jgi:hypothetical protein
LPIMIFGFDRLARKWSTDPTSTVSLAIQRNMLRRDTPKSFQTLWHAIWSDAESYTDSNYFKERVEIWLQFLWVVVDRGSTVSARMPMLAERNAKAPTTDVQIVEKAHEMLMLLPFKWQKWGLDWGRFSERVSLRSATTTTTNSTTTTTTTTTTAPTTTTTTTTTAPTTRTDDDATTTDDDVPGSNVGS